MPRPEIEKALDRLFAARLEEFTATRSAIAREFRAAGDAEAARTIEQAHKPMVSAWVVNQLARRAHEDLVRLLDLGGKLRTAQEVVLGGGAVQSLRDTAAAERRLAQKLSERGSAILREAGHAGSHVEEIRRTLHASASASEQDRERLVRGRLERPLAVAGIEDMLRGTSVPELRAEVSRAARAPRREPSHTPIDRRRQQEAQQARDSARAEADQTARRAHDLAEEARRSLRQAEEAERVARAAVERARQAQIDADEAAARSAAAARRLQQAEAALREAHGLP